jgi:hypothetical protein
VFDLVFALFANEWYQSLVRDSIEKNRMSTLFRRAAAVRRTHRYQAILGDASLLRAGVVLHWCLDYEAESDSCPTWSRIRRDLRLQKLRCYQILLHCCCFGTIVCRSCCCAVLRKLFF